MVALSLYCATTLRLPGVALSVLSVFGITLCCRGFGVRNSEHMTRAIALPVFVVALSGIICAEVAGAKENMFIGTARQLVSLKDQWQGTLILVGQPAEERGAGARMMLADGLFERFPRPDYNLALHVFPELAAGTVNYTKGYAFANVDSVDIAVHGIGGHGAYPHKTKDPVVLAAKIILSLQTLVSREVSPLDPAVVTVGSIHGGTKHNIISDRVDLQLTVRSYSDKVKYQLLEGIKRISLAEGRAHGLPDSLLPTVRIKNEATPLCI